MAFSYVVYRPDAEWIEDENGMIICSNCKQPPVNPININGQSVFNLTPVKEYMTFCPRCGAKIIKEENKELNQ